MPPIREILVAYVLSTTFLTSGCWLAHERAAPPLVPDETPPSICPVPPVGDGRALIVLHERDGTSFLSRRDESGALTTITDALDGVGAGLGIGMLVVGPRGDYAVVHDFQSLDRAFLVDLDDGTRWRIASLLPPDAREVCTTPRLSAGIAVHFRQDGAAVLIGCSVEEEDGRATTGTWEIETTSRDVREIAGACASATYARNAPCDTHVEWRDCDGGTFTHGELRRLDGTVRDVPGETWVLSPGAILAAEDAIRGRLLLHDANGEPHTLIASLDRSRPFSFYAAPLSTGRAVLFTTRLGFTVLTADGRITPFASPCAGTTPSIVNASADGETFFMSCNTSRRSYFVDPGGGDATPIPALDDEVVQVWSWSADRRWALVSAFAPSGTTFLRVSRRGDEALTIAPREPALGRVLFVDFASPAPQGW